MVCKRWICNQVHLQHMQHMQRSGWLLILLLINLALLFSFACSEPNPKEHLFLFFYCEMQGCLKRWTSINHLQRHSWNLDTLDIVGLLISTLHRSIWLRFECLSMSLMTHTHTLRCTCTPLTFQRRFIFQLFWQRPFIAKDGLFSLFICTPFVHLF